MFKKGMLLYTKKVADAQLGHEVTLTARVFQQKVENLTYDNPFMSVPSQYKGLLGQSADQIKAQGFALEKACLSDNDLPVDVTPEEVDLFENSDILDRPTVLVDLNWRFYQQIIAVENAANDQERADALLALGETVYFLSLEEPEE